MIQPHWDLTSLGTLWLLPRSTRLPLSLRPRGYNSGGCNGEPSEKMWSRQCFICSIFQDVSFKKQLQQPPWSIDFPKILPKLMAEEPLPPRRLQGYHLNHENGVATWLFYHIRESQKPTNPPTKLTPTDPQIHKLTPIWKPNPQTHAAWKCGFMGFWISNSQTHIINPQTHRTHATHATHKLTWISYTPGQRSPHRLPRSRYKVSNRALTLLFRTFLAAVLRTIHL